MTTVLVCGGRDYHKRHKVFEELDKAHALLPITLIIHGDAKGADLLADAWALSRGIPRRAYPADWNKNGRAAGPIRNQRMLAEGRPDRVIAFPGGKGTADMVGRALKAGLPVLQIREAPKQRGFFPSTED